METCNSGIYQIKNTINGKVYVGSSRNYKKRIKQHISSLIKNNHHSPKLQNAYNKYGEKAFEFSIIEYVVNQEDLVIREQHWIDTLDSFSNGYNTRPRAENNGGYSPSEETRQKMSAAAKNKIFSEETKAKIAKSKLGKPRSPETKEKLRIANLGKKMPEHTKQRLIESNLGRTGQVHTEETKDRIRKKILGTKMSDESKKKIAEFHRGKAKTPEAIEKTRQANLGIKRSEETKQKLKEAWKKRKIREAIERETREDTFVVMMATKLYWDQKLAGMQAQHV